MLPLPGDAALAATDLYGEYEKVKRVLRQLLPPEALGGDPRFILACELCGQLMLNQDKIEIETMHEHYDQVHPGVVVETEDKVSGIRLNLLYIQPGLPPKGSK